MRKFVVAVALLLGVVFIFTKLAEVQAIAGTLQKGDWRFILLAIGVEAAWLLNVALSYQALYKMFGLEEKIERLLLLSSAAYFVNIVAPSVGMGGMAIFISDARLRSHSTARVTLAGVLYLLFDYGAFLCVLALGLLVEFRRNNLNTPELVASAFLAVLASAIGLLLYLGMHSAAQLSAALSWMARLVNGLVRPFIRRDYLSEQRAHEFAYEAADGLREIRQKPKNILLPLALGLSSKALLISVLFLMFLAFKVPFSVGTLIAGFSIGYLFLIVSPTPAGLGVVEGALTLALTSLYIPLGAATVLTLAYRGITFWLPLLVGVISFRWLSHAGLRTPGTG